MLSEEKLSYEVKALLILHSLNFLKEAPPFCPPPKCKGESKVLKRIKIEKIALGKLNLFLLLHVLTKRISHAAIFQRNGNGRSSVQQ